MSLFDKLKNAMPSEDSKIIKQYQKLLAEEDFVNSKKLIEEAYASNPDSKQISYWYTARLINDRDNTKIEELVKKDKKLVKDVLGGYLENLNSILLNKQFLPKAFDTV